MVSSLEIEWASSYILTIDKMQRIQNLLARTVANASWFDNATVVTRSLSSGCLSDRESSSIWGYLALKPNIHCCLRTSKIFSPVIIPPSSLGPLPFISFSNQ